MLRQEVWMRVVLHSNPGWMSVPLLLVVGLAYAWVVGRIVSAQAQLRAWPDFLARSGSVLGRVPSAKQREADHEEKRSLRLYLMFRDHVGRR